MFNMSGTEMLVILVVALLVLGPQKLPEAARQMGKAMTEIRKLSGGFQDEMRRAMDDSLASPSPSPSPTAGELGAPTITTGDDDAAPTPS